MSRFPYSQQLQRNLTLADFQGPAGNAVYFSFPLIARAGFVYMLSALRMFNQQLNGTGSQFNYKATISDGTVLDVGSFGYGVTPNDNKVLLDFTNPIPVWSGSVDVLVTWAGTAAPWTDLLTVSLLGDLVSEGGQAV